MKVNSRPKNVRNVRKKYIYFNKIKNKEGITLVALVITIILLLILSGITISQLTQNKLFVKAKEAKEKWKEVQIKENKILTEYENELKDKDIQEWEGLLEKLGLNINYTQEDLINNKDNILEKFLQNEDGVDYIFKNSNLYIENIKNNLEKMNILANSEIAMKKLANNNNIKYEMLINQNTYTILKDSKYYDYILDSSEKIPNMTSNNTPSGKVTYSSAATYRDHFMDGYLAFHDVLNDYDCWSPPWGTIGWLAYEYENEMLLYGFDFLRRYTKLY